MVQEIYYFSLISSHMIISKLHQAAWGILKEAIPWSFLFH